MLIFELFQPQVEGMGFLGEKDVEEAANAAQQAAIAIAMKKAHNKPKTEGLRDPADNPCWKGYHPVGTKKKNGRTVPNCVPRR